MRAWPSTSEENVMQFQCANVAVTATVENPLVRRAYEDAWAIDDATARINVAVAESPFASNIFATLLYVPNVGDQFVLECEELYASEQVIQSLGRPVLRLPADRTPVELELDILRHYAILFDDYSACWLVRDMQEFLQLLTKVEVKEWIGTYWRNGQPTLVSHLIWSGGFDRQPYSLERAFLQLCRSYTVGFLLGPSHNHAELYTCQSEILDRVLQHIASAEAEP
jgi:hypothetical protein